MADELSNPTKRELALEQLVVGILLDGEMRRPGYMKEVAEAAAWARFRVDVDGEFLDLLRDLRSEARRAGIAVEANA